MPARQVFYLSCPRKRMAVRNNFGHLWLCDTALWLVIPAQAGIQ
jgi:hypothetical protein